jgi:septal ring factor EnvC (AmiA/AmiB activator)
MNYSTKQFLVALVIVMTILAVLGSIFYSFQRLELAAASNQVTDLQSTVASQAGQIAQLTSENTDMKTDLKAITGDLLEVDSKLTNSNIAIKKLEHQNGLLEEKGRMYLLNMMRLEAQPTCAPALYTALPGQP